MESFIFFIHGWEKTTQPRYLLKVFFSTLFPLFVGGAGLGVRDEMVRKGRASRRGPGDAHCTLVLEEGGLQSGAW